MEKFSIDEFRNMFETLYCVRHPEVVESNCYGDCICCEVKAFIKFLESRGESDV